MAMTEQCRSRMLRCLERIPMFMYYQGEIRAEETDAPLHRFEGLAIARPALEFLEVFALDLLEIDMK